MRQDIKTVELTGAEVCVMGLGGQHMAIRNDGGGTIYASAEPGIVPDADGVIAIPAGAAATYPGTNGTVYLLGSGKAQIMGTDYYNASFTPAASSGGSGGGGTYILPPTSPTNLGGMIVGDGLSADASGRVSVNIAKDSDVEDALDSIFNN